MSNSPHRTTPAADERSCRNWLSPFGALVRVALFVLFASLTSCSKTTERRLHEVPCGRGTLALDLRVVTHAPAPSDVTFTLVFEDGRERREVDVLKPRATVWCASEEAHRFTPFSAGPDRGPVFVSPRSFTLDEFDVLRTTLASTHTSFEARATFASLAVSYDYGADLVLTSIRYLDYEALRRVYLGSRRDVRVLVVPDGGVWMEHPHGSLLLGSVVDRGRKVLFGAPLATLRVEHVADPVEYAMSAVDEHGRRLGDEFEVQRLSAGEYEAWVARDRAERAR